MFCVLWTSDTGCVVFLSSAAGGYCSAVLDSAGQLLVFWVQSERLT